MSTLSTLISSSSGGGGGSVPIGSSLNLLHNTPTVTLNGEVFLQNGITASPATYPDAPVRTFLLDGSYEEDTKSSLFSPWAGNTKGTTARNGMCRDYSSQGSGVYYHLNTWGALNRFEDEGATWTGYIALDASIPTPNGISNNCGGLSVVHPTNSYYAGKLCVYSNSDYTLYFFDPVTLALDSTLPLTGGWQYASGIQDSIGISWKADTYTVSMRDATNGYAHTIYEHDLSSGAYNGTSVAHAYNNSIGFDGATVWIPANTNADPTNRPTHMGWRHNSNGSNELFRMAPSYNLHYNQALDPSHTPSNSGGPHINGYGYLHFMNNSNTSVAQRGYAGSAGWTDFLPTKFIAFSGVAFDGTDSRYHGVVDNKKAYPINYTASGSAIVGTPIDMSAGSDPYRFTSDGTHLYNMNGTTVDKYLQSNGSLVSSASIAGQFTGTNAVGIAYNNGNSLFYVLDKSNSQVQVYNALWVHQTTITLDDGIHASETLTSMSIDAVQTLWVVTTTSLRTYSISGALMTSIVSYDGQHDSSFSGGHINLYQNTNTASVSYYGLINKVGNPQGAPGSVTSSYTRVG